MPLLRLLYNADKSISRSHDVGLFSDFADDPIEDGLTFFDLATWKLPSPSFCFNQQYLVSPFHEHPSRDDMFWHKHLLLSGIKHHSLAQSLSHKGIAGL